MVEEVIRGGERFPAANKQSGVLEDIMKLTEATKVVETVESLKLKTACERYLEHLKTIGQQPSTMRTARRTLDLLIDEMGEQKEVGKILAVHVAKFFKSEAATMQPGKDGPKPKAEASIIQCHRIVRMALGWWKEAGWMEKLPLPASESRFAERMEKSGVGHRVCVHVVRSGPTGEIQNEAR